jgi:hypothetical protein
MIDANDVHHADHAKHSSARDTRRGRTEDGMSTAEYAVGTVSACGFGGLLYTLLTSGFGQNLLEGIINKVADLLPF